VTYGVPVNDRPAARPNRSGSDSALSKAEKRAAAKLARERAAAAAARRRMLSIVGAAVAVIAVIGLVVFLAVRGDDSPSTPDAAASATPGGTSAAASAAPFPQLPEGADPALGTKPAVTAGTGALTKLTVTTLVEGKGPATQAGQTLSVNYVGVTYADGKEFDASWNRKQPISFAVGKSEVIPGWDQGLVGVKVGSRVQLDIPSNLAYGDSPEGGRPAGPLRFVVDVLAAS
jgi:peptidylprolyl isomerase